jgi:hypothetical protein
MIQVKRLGPAAEESLAARSAAMRGELGGLHLSRRLQHQQPVLPGSRPAFGEDVWGSLSAPEPSCIE